MRFFPTCTPGLAAGLAMTATLVLASLAPAFGATQPGMPVFEAMRLTMMADAPKALDDYFSQAARAKWNDGAGSLLDDKETAYFFSFALNNPVPLGDDSFCVIFFNPWADGVMFTKWGKVDGSWKIRLFKFASGELLRGEPISEKNILPAWVTDTGMILDNQSATFHKTLEIINAKDFTTDAFYQGGRDQELVSLMGIKSRAYTRRVTASAILADDATYEKVEHSLDTIFDTIASKDATKIKTAFKPLPEQAVDLLLGVPDEFLDTAAGNWYIKKGDSLIIFITSFASPRVYLYAQIDADGGITTFLNSWDAVPQ